MILKHAIDIAVANLLGNGLAKTEFTSPCAAGFLGFFAMATPMALAARCTILGAGGAPVGGTRITPFDAHKQKSIAAKGGNTVRGTVIDVPLIAIITALVTLVVFS
jgi:hypothetical protein